MFCCFSAGRVRLPPSPVWDLVQAPPLQVLQLPQPATFQDEDTSRCRQGMGVLRVEAHIQIPSGHLPSRATRSWEHLFVYVVLAAFVANAGS